MAVIKISIIRYVKYDLVPNDCCYLTLIINILIGSLLQTHSCGPIPLKQLSLRRPLANGEWNGWTNSDVANGDFDVWA